MLVLLLVWCLFTVHAQQLTVNTQYGAVRGGLASPTVRVWRGIPYAAPPIGDLRFKSPTAPAPWSPAVRDCTTDRSHLCPQLASIFGIVVGNEDCLYMDIYSPANATSTSKLPVMVWFYGGGYVFGDKREFGLYDATNLVNNHNYVHVALNYRLSVLGFLSLPGLQKETADGSTGNYGVQDQRMVLQFVQNNIANFGGDPTQVTIFGESAGAFSVCWHLVSPLSKGLFRAAIMESGNCDSPAFFYPVSNAIEFGKSYSNAVGCNASIFNDQQLVECLRQLPTWKILDGGAALQSQLTATASWRPALYPFMPWGPAIDGTPSGLLDLPLNLIQSGSFNRVPLIIGTNANEGNIFIPGIPIITGVSFPLTETSFKQAMTVFFNLTTINQITQMYYYSGPTWEQVMAIIIRDFFFACEARRVAGAWSKYMTPSYLYHFTFVAPNWVDQWALGDYHSSELEFVFDNPWPPLIHYFDEEDEMMAATFGGYWTNFARTMSPNNGPFKPLNQWPMYDPQAEAIINMRVPTVIDHQYLENVCPFWDTVHELGSLRRN